MNNLIVKNEFYQNKLSWINSSKIGLTVDDKMQPIPWFNYASIEYLKKIIKNDDVVFEFGCGSSTLFFYKKIKKIIAIETNKFWFDYITNIIINNDKKFFKNANYFINDNAEIFLNENGLNDNNYEKFAFNYANKNNIKFNLIIIDSIKRYKSVINSVNALTEDGVMILDDSQRIGYKKIFDYIKKIDMQNISFSGIAPAQLTIKSTSFFKKNSSIFE